MKQHEYQQSVLTMQKSVTITVTPQRSNSLDYLNFEEKRQLIASSLSLSDILQVGPAVAAQAAKDVASNTSSIIGCIITYFYILICMLLIFLQQFICGFFV
jgi:hypothetical protein